MVFFFFFLSEKHKTYHIKDEQLARDGFKKFMKPDPCGFSNCRFSQVCNHIHCVRDGCNYVLHSSGQLLSHKRKHERKDSEIAYRKFKLAQQAVMNMSGGCSSGGNGGGGGSGGIGVGSAAGVNQDQVSDDEWGLPWDGRRRGAHGAADSQMNELSISSSSSLQFLHQQANSLASLSALAAQAGDAASYSNSSSDGGGGPMSPLSTTPRGPSKMGGGGGGGGQGFFTDNSCTTVDGGAGSPEDVEMWPRYLTRFKPNTCTGGSGCALYDADHFHCKEPNCDAPVKYVITAHDIIIYVIYFISTEVKKPLKRTLAITTTRSESTRVSTRVDRRTVKTRALRNNISIAF